MHAIGSTEEIVTKMYNCTIEISGIFASEI